MTNAFAEAHGLAKVADDGEAAKVVDLGNGITGQRQPDGRIAVFNSNGRPAGFTISDSEAAAMR